MKAGGAKLLVALLAVRPLTALGDGTVSAPDPVGEKLWREQLLPHLFPLAVFLGAGILFLALVIVHHWRNHRAQAPEPPCG